MERCEQHLRLKLYDGNCPDCVIDREVGKVGEAAAIRIAELESKLDRLRNIAADFDAGRCDDVDALSSMLRIVEEPPK